MAKKKNNEQSKKNKLNMKKTTVIGIAVFVIISIVLGVLTILTENEVVSKKKEKNLNPELARAMTYEEFHEGDENIEGTNNVKFSAFFLRDLDEDGYAEKIKGTCREIGKEDTLYMELNVLSAGYLKDGKIEINGQNFYLATSLPKDQQLKNSYIGKNISKIEFNDIQNGTQKMINGMVRSGDYSSDYSKMDALANNINNYSRNDNKIIFTGTYVNGNGNEIEIRKEINLNVDWYGKAETKITKIRQNSENIQSMINEEEDTLNLSFSIDSNEIQNSLILSKNYVEGVIPELNGFKPLSVTTTSGVNFEYNSETGKFTIEKNAQINDNGKIEKNAYSYTDRREYPIYRYNSYKINVVYPLESYKSMDGDTVTLRIPVETYYEGYNNINSEFTNPLKSNVAQDTIIANFSNPKGTGIQFEIKVGKYLTSPTIRYAVSKEKPLKIYNGISEEEQNDLYIVKWYGYTGINGQLPGITMKETKTGDAQVTDQFIKNDNTTESMENLTTNVGIGFGGADRLLGSEGWIKVYDEETDNLLVTFTSNGIDDTEKWGNYTEATPYKYEFPVKHIRVETSSTNVSSSIVVYNIKKLDDGYITENYTKEEFDNFTYIQSKLVGYTENTYINTSTHQAKYEAPYSIAKIELSKKTLSTQETEENDIITITANANSDYNQIGWYNGSFLIKIPDEILDVEINNISINNTNIEILSYEVIERENGRFIKINTSNKVENAQSYVITINTNLTPDPRVATMTKQLELYASNEEVQNYYYYSEDIYDVNDNLNTQELVNKTSTSINLVSPNSLLTNQTMELAGEDIANNEFVIAPKVMELKPLYDSEEKQEVKIGVQIKNNYASTISEVKLLGKIPFEGNKYVISQGDLESEFSTTMKPTGIEVPEELQNHVTVYYTENENPTKDILDSSNGWTLKENVTDWSKIKSYIIDMEDEVIEQGKEYVFYYMIEVPNGIDLNKVSYSHHGVYFSLDTNEGKYRTQTEPNKVGIKIYEKYNLKLTKYQKGKENKVAGATYKISKLDENENVEETSTATTNADGQLEMTNLYAEKVYKIEEIKTPVEYELNSDVIKFIAHANENGVITVEKLEGTTRGDLTVTRQTGENYKVNISVEDEIQPNLTIIKTNKDTDEPIRNVRYKITGEGLSADGRILTTNVYGEVICKGLKIGAEYTLKEVKAEGYYLNNGEIKFKFENNNGTYDVDVTEDESIKNMTTIDENGIPTIKLELTDEKIPTYNLK